LPAKAADVEVPAELDILLNQTIKKVGEDIESMKFNTSVSQLMILSNALIKLEKVPKKVLEAFLTLLAPFAPHITEELWAEMGHTSSIHLEKWPAYDPSKLTESSVELGVQIAGKMRGTIVVSPEATEEEAVLAARANERLSALIPENPKRVVYVAGRILNIIP
jgi:leucyl-tRNA synthetase